VRLASPARRIHQSHAAPRDPSSVGESRLRQPGWIYSVPWPQQHARGKEKYEFVARRTPVQYYRTTLHLGRGVIDDTQVREAAGEAPRCDERCATAH
jgi:hypothetical protein